MTRVPCLLSDALGMPSSHRSHTELSTLVRFFASPKERNKKRHHFPLFVPTHPLSQVFSAEQHAVFTQLRTLVARAAAMPLEAFMRIVNTAIANAATGGVRPNPAAQRAETQRSTWATAVLPGIMASLRAIIPSNIVRIALNHLHNSGRFPVNRTKDGVQYPQAGLFLYMRGPDGVADLPTNVQRGARPSAFSMAIGPRTVDASGNITTPVYALCEHRNSDGTSTFHVLYLCTAFTIATWICSCPPSGEVNADGFYTPSAPDCVGRLSVEAMDMLVAAMRGTPDASYETITRPAVVHALADAATNAAALAASAMPPTAAAGGAGAGGGASAAGAASAADDSVNVEDDDDEPSPASAASASSGSKRRRASPK